MTSRIPVGGPLRLMAMALGLGVGFFSATPGRAGDGEAPFVGPRPKGLKPGKVYPKHPGPASGTLGYGNPGIYQGFQGFGLGYHPGYGYGGAARGVGAEGGYPLYGGPGYPHPWPVLRRLGPITPFCYFGGPGYPTPDHPNYYGGVGALAPDQPVVTIEDPLGYAGGYGEFTGAIPDAEAKFAPYESIIATDSPTGRGGGAAPAGPAYSRPGAGEVPGAAPPGAVIGIETAPVAAMGDRGVRVTRVAPGSLAEKAGLQVGDTIETINGYPAEGPTNLAWVVANAAPGKVLRMGVRGAGDAPMRSITIQLP